MKNFKMFFYALLLSPSVPAFAAEPSLRFDLNSDALSYNFIMENPSDAPIKCESIEVEAQLGDKDCSEIVSIYKFKMNHRSIAAETSVENSTFGLDFSHQSNSKYKNRIFCGQPNFKLDCK